MSLWWLVPLISLTHQNLVLLPKKTWCWWLNLLPPANHFLSFVLHLKQEMDRAQCYYYSHDICFTVESSFDPAESCHCDNSGYQSPYEGHVQNGFSAEWPHLLLLYAKAEAYPHASFNHNARYVEIIHCHQACICVVTPADQAWKIKSSVNSFTVPVGEEERNEVFSLSSQSSV